MGGYCDWAVEGGGHRCPELAVAIFGDTCTGRREWSCEKVPQLEVS